MKKEKTVQKPKMERLETRIKKDLKKSLRMFCAMNDLTIQDSVEMALSRLLSDKVKANTTSTIK